MSPRYDRVLREEREKVERTLLPGGQFRFLVENIPVLPDDPYSLDIQLRENNELMYYHGTTRLLTIRFFLMDGAVHVRATADKAYVNKSGCQSEYAELMKSWQPKESAVLHNAFQAYLPKAISAANPKYYRNGKEGYWQNMLCVRFGRIWKPGDEWLIIDRECVLGFDNKEEKRDFYKKARSEYQEIKDTLQRTDTAKWGEPRCKAFGDELDLLAVSEHGHLVVIELKHGTNCSGIYWGPLQVGFYHRAFATVRADAVVGIKELARQKVRLGLLPSQAAELIDRSGLAQVDQVLAIAEPNDNSSCWEKLKTVRGEITKIGLDRTSPLRIVKVSSQTDSAHRAPIFPDNECEATRGVSLQDMLD